MPFLQGIFLTQGSNPHSLMSPALAGRFFTTHATWEAQILQATTTDPACCKEILKILHATGETQCSQTSKLIYI